MVPGQGFLGCVRDFQVDKETDQEAGLEELAFTKAPHWKSGMFRNLRLELEGGAGEV